MSGSVLKVAMGGHSTAGIKDENQDAFAAWHGTDAELTNKGVTAVIADGVSACSRAKEASQMAVTSFINDYRQTPVSWTVKKSRWFMIRHHWGKCWPQVLAIPIRVVR